MPKKVTKHFLDSSVARPLLTGTKFYQSYLLDYFQGDPIYISKYVQMELKRSHVMSMIGFFMTLDSPTIPDVDDAMKLWSNSFQSSELKSTLQFIFDLLATRGIDFHSPKAKDLALAELWRLIKTTLLRIEMKFKDAGTDSTRCARRGKILSISADDLEKIREDLRTFAYKFNDIKTCRQNCRIDDFLLQKHEGDVKRLIKLGSSLPSNNANKGFKKIAERLNVIATKGGESCTCNTCEAIGDAVIALDAPREFILEHTDRSFNHLCPAVNQPHHQLESETAFHNRHKLT